MKPPMPLSTSGPSWRWMPDRPAHRRGMDSCGSDQPRNPAIDLNARLGSIQTNMQPIDMQIIGNELALKWPDHVEQFLPLETLRRACPCAGCQGERDIMGNVYKAPPKPLTPQSFQLVKLERIGGYAIQPFWGDGHSSGLFSYDYLRRLGDGNPADS